MNPRQNMIIANDKIITPNVIFCKYNSKTHKYDIKFKTGQIYSYGYNHVTWIKEPKELNPSNFRIMHNKKELYGISAIYVFRNGNQKYWHLCFQSGIECDYKSNELVINVSCFNDALSQNIFEYLKESADFISLKAEDGTKLLSKQFEKLNFVDEKMAFSTYVNPKHNPLKKLDYVTPIFPFGCNASQLKAVKNAFENQISVIEGPPGTGKTQTILNIIANIIINKKTVQIVSNNNSATANVLEKLSTPEYNMGFLVAALGNSENKAHFIIEQDGRYPEIIQTWATNLSHRSDFFKGVQERSEEINEIFRKQERLAIARQKLNEVELEYEYFKQYSNESGNSPLNVKIRKKLTTEKILRLLRECRLFSSTGKQPSFIFKIKSRFIYGISERGFYKKDMADIMMFLQSLFYNTTRAKLIQEIKDFEKVLSDSNQKKMTEEFTNMSLGYLRAALYRRYGKTAQRRVFDNKDLCTNPCDVQMEYPVILSTTFSARSSLGASAEFDYLIMDEASQVDVSTGALALSCAKNAVIVGDTKQLPNVVTTDNKLRLQTIFDSFEIDRGYNFTENSFLKSVCTVIPDVPKTLLREHYRCHPKIINFCNQKFYDGELIVMTEDNNEKKPISVIKTVVGNHERDRMNQRQIDVVKNELLPTLPYSDEETGIIAPYRNQANAIKDALYDRRIDVATVHKFQGREKDAIIITTVDDEVTDFSDDPYLLNVAVSRAKKSLSLVVSGNKQPKDSNIADLIDYIEYNNFTVSESAIYSVFDLLYRQYTESRLNYLKNFKKVSEFDSENLMYALIQDVFVENNYSALNVICHQPLNMLIRDTYLLNDEERRYAMHSATHLDFLIYNRISKKPVLAVEVDGFHYHKKGTLQFERDKKKDHILELYKIPLLNFPTNSSGEREKLKEKLKEIVEAKV